MNRIDPNPVYPIHPVLPVSLICEIPVPIGGKDCFLHRYLW